jgi:hypothetical protein
MSLIQGSALTLSLGCVEGYGDGSLAWDVFSWSVEKQDSSGKLVGLQNLGPLLLVFVS